MAEKIHMAVSHLCYLAPELLFPQPGQPTGRPPAGLDQQGQLGLPGLAVRPVPSIGLDRPARLAWPGPSGFSDKNNIQNVKVSKMAATAVIFGTLTFLIFRFELEGQRGKRAGLYLFPFNPTNEKLPYGFMLIYFESPCRMIYKN